MISVKMSIGIAFIIIFGSIALLAKLRMKKTKLEFDRKMAEFERSNDILKRISSKLDSMDENEKVDPKKIAELEELAKALKEE